MKILQINTVYPSGSTGKIVRDIHLDLIDKGYESIVCYGRGEMIVEKNVYKVAPELIMKLQSLRSKVTGFAYSGCIYSTHSIINLIRKEKPDIVHLHCINGFMVNIYKLLKFLKENKINTVLTLHAEFMYTAGCGYALDCVKWKAGCDKCEQKGLGRPSSKIFDRSKKEWKMMNKAFCGFENIIVTSVSKWLYDRAIQSPFFTKVQMLVVLNGIDTKKIFRPINTKEIKEKYELTNEKILLHVTADFLNPIKGGKYIVDLAVRLKDENIKIFIIGFNGDKTILPSNIIALSHIDNQVDLATFYSMADLTILTSKKETFSMICAESLSCGTPVVGFEAGAPETISIQKYSEFVKQGDIDSLEHIIRKWISYKEKLGNEIAEIAEEFYSKQKMISSYELIYKNLRGNTNE